MMESLKVVKILTLILCWVSMVLILIGLLTINNGSMALQGNQGLKPILLLTMAGGTNDPSKVAVDSIVLDFVLGDISAIVSGITYLFIGIGILIAASISATIMLGIN